MRHLPALIALVAAAGLGAIGVARGTWAVGGSDSSCYAVSAKAFAAWQLQPTSSLAVRAPWRGGAASFAPAGFVRSPVRADAASPVCAPGFSLLMVPFVWLGGLGGIFWVTPAAGALLVWLTFVLGRRLGGPWAGALAAILTATSPIVLYQVVQPMNDVATAALWVAVVTAAPVPWGAGVLTGLALLVRPNLAPVALVAGILVPVLFAGPTDRFRRWLIVAATYAVAALPGVAIVAWLNAMLYGSAFHSGYGDLGSLFAWSFVPVNAARYARWFVETHTAFPVIALAAPFVCARDRRGVAWLALGVASAVVTIYLFYRPFEDWWYLRFLLPAVVLTLVLASTAVIALATRLHTSGAPVVCLALAALLGASYVRTADRRLAFSLQAFEQRFRDSGQLVRDRLPANAAFVTVWQSGTIRFYGDRETILWDAVDPSQFDMALSWLTQAGYHPYILVERNEEEPFRQRFEGWAYAGPIDWPPRYDVDRQVRIFDPADRKPYLAGEALRTEYVWGEGRR